MFLFSKLVFILLGCAAVYGEKERVTDGPVSPKDQQKSREVDKLPINAGKENVLKFAQKLDTNKDGFVDQNELHDWVVQAYLSTDNQEAEERMSELDGNADGFVSWEEYQFDSFPEDELENNKEDQKLLEQDKLYFNQADENKDGKLSLDELKAFITPENYPHMHFVIVEATLAEKDTNGDGAIDMTEFLGEIGENLNSEWLPIEKERFHSEYDVNHDGKLTGDEIRHWLLPDATVVGAHEANHLLANADDNKDSKLSYDEIVKHHALFAKSDASSEHDFLHPYAHEEL